MKKSDTTPTLFPMTFPSSLPPLGDAGWKIHRSLMRHGVWLRVSRDLAHEMEHQLVNGFLLYCAALLDWWEENITFDFEEPMSPATLAYLCRRVLSDHEYRASLQAIIDAGERDIVADARATHDPRKQWQRQAASVV